MFIAGSVRPMDRAGGFTRKGAKSDLHSLDVHSLSRLDQALDEQLSSFEAGLSNDQVGAAGVHRLTPMPMPYNSR